MQHVDTALIVGCYIAVIYLYVWVFKNMEAMREMLHSHTNQTGQHVEGKDLVYRDVCAIQVKRFEEKLADVKSDLIDLKSSINSGFDDVKDALKEAREDRRRRSSDDG